MRIIRQVRISIAIAFMVSCMFMFVPCVQSFGQNPSPTPTLSPTPTPDPTPASEDVAPKRVDYFMPDLPPGVTTYNNKLFSVRVGFAVLADYMFVGQDSVSLSQVGPQASVFDLRAGRLMFSGQFKFKRPWTYLISGDYDEHHLRGERRFDILDFNLTIPLWKKARITIGKQKEPFIFEMVAVAAFLPQQERVLNQFFVSRNIGVRYFDNFLHDRMSLSMGVYNDWFQTGLKLRESGYQVSGRVTALPFESENHRTFLHLGLGLRYDGANKDQMRFRSKPEANAIDYYADTGTFTAKYAHELSFELLYNRRSFSVLAEHARAWVKSPSTQNPSFNGSYVTVSYFLTDDTRPYDKRNGSITPISPKSRWGAVELVGRVGHMDLDDKILKGGKLTTWYAGVNWWASQQWKVGMGYGYADLDRFNTSGRTQRFITRLQWTY